LSGVRLGAVVIVIHVACDDDAFRAVVTDFLNRQRDMCVLRAEPQRGDAPDVVVFGVSPGSNVASHTPEFRDMASTGAAIVVFCTTPEQAADFEDLGVEYLVDVDEPARELAVAVRAAYRRRTGQAIH
jgi:hypothetical protein